MESVENDNRQGHRSAPRYGHSRLWFDFIRRESVCWSSCVNLELVLTKRASPNNETER